MKRVALSTVVRETNNFSGDSNAVYGLLMAARVTDPSALRFVRRRVTLADVQPGGDVSKVRVQKLRKVIRRDGGLMPIVIDCNGFIVDGNHRAVAAQREGHTTADAFVQQCPRAKK